ncbi:MAG: (E)-4-hydroxy-3-methylbut-2-enyl-diphosphate synthase [Bacteroidetes bacterium]|nr:(E)-4-hydroxy-3-methylbut-2-enyl-diphosphate synthase [Bacteroidota bacterium]
MQHPTSNILKNIYCNSLFEYSRLKTREVKVGELRIGGTNPIRIQSMTTTDTMDTIKTVEQSIRMIEAGCELVRITAPSINEAKNLENIKNELRKRGYNTPICADIHFTPNAAELAAGIVEKVRVNPGNYADRKKFEHIEYTDKSYDEELERIRERFLPLIKICKENGTAMRIGTNHGSLSDRILSRYGDTPLGMVESALEFLRICEEVNYFDIVLSMKASNTQVMVQAYRLLVHKMLETDRNYPLHLGVTEAGDGEDGRIKSAVGIGTLLEDGLGDTIRVSLTEEPEFEIPVAKNLIERYSKRKMADGRWQMADGQVSKLSYSPFEYRRRETAPVVNIGGYNVPRVVADFSDLSPIPSPQREGRVTPASFGAVGYNYSEKFDKWNLSDQACDYIYLGNNEIDFEIPGTLGLIYNAKTFSKLKNKTRAYPLFCGEEYFSMEERSKELNFVSVDQDSLKNLKSKIQNPDSTLVLIFETNNEHSMAEQRRMFFELMSPLSDSPDKGKGLKIPVIIKRTYKDISEEKFQLYSSTDFGGLLLDGFGDGVWISYPYPKGRNTEKENSTIAGSKQQIPLGRGATNSTAFGILQATRTRISKTEYISCPSCGRTLFDLQETTAKIRARTSHLKGVKIGIMGCIVNGPGEMADADYGYVGTSVGKITLYKGKEVVKKNITAETAVDELIELIKSNGDWVETK